MAAGTVRFNGDAKALLKQAGKDSLLDAFLQLTKVEAQA
jgi:hypothetical protein